MPIRSFRPYAAALLVPALALGYLCGTSDVVSAMPTGQGGYQLIVVGIPDLAGDGAYSPDCAGCDGKFETGDAIRGRDNPLPPLVFILRDADGAELKRTSSTRQSNGRQTVTFYVGEPARYEVWLLSVSSGWEICPGAGAGQWVEESSFENSARAARVQFGFWHGCDAPTATPQDEPPTALPTVSLTPVTAYPTPVPTHVPAASAPPTDAPKPPDEVSDDDSASPEPEPEAGDTGSEGETSSGTGSILGLVFVDRNADGLLGPDEPGVPGVSVRILDGGWRQYKHTTGAGNYRFGRLATGSYEVTMELPEGYRFTTVDRHTNVLVEGEAVAGIDFGLEPAFEQASKVPAAAPILGLGLPRTGVLPLSSGRVLLGLAAVIGALGLIGSVLESGLARRS